MVRRGFVIEIVKILSARAEAFERIKVKPHWTMPVVLVIVGLTLLSWFKTCFEKGSIAFDFVVIAFILVVLWACISLSWLIISCFVYGAIWFFDEKSEPQFRSTFSVVAHAGVVFLLGEVINFLLIQSNILDPESFPLPNRFPLGLDFLLIGRSANPVLATFLHSINPFVVWYFLLISIGMSTVNEISRQTSVAVTLLTWFALVSFIAVIVLTIGGTSFGIRL